jgi:hypothetical protein
MPADDFGRTFVKLLPAFIAECEETAKAFHEDFPAYRERHPALSELSAHENWVASRERADLALKWTADEQKGE